MPHIRVFFCFQLNAGILKAVEIRMDIEVGIDLECTILPDDQLVEPDDGKSTPQAVNDIIDDLIWRIEFVVWTDDLCQCVNSEILLDIPTFVWDFLIQALFRPSDFSQLFCGISVLSPDFG